MYDYGYIEMNKEVILLYLEKALKDYKISLWFSWFTLIPNLLNTNDGFCHYFKCTIGEDYYKTIIDELSQDRLFCEDKKFSSYWYPNYTSYLHKNYRKPFLYRIKNLQKTIDRLKLEIFEEDKTEWLLNNYGKGIKQTYQ